MPGEVRGKLMLEKMPEEVRGKIMLDKVPGKLLRKLYIRKRCLASCIQDCRESDRKSAGSRMQCSKPQLEKKTVHES